MNFSRRHVLSLPAGVLLSRWLKGASPALFEEVPPAASGITCVHENAMSPQRYLPETMGSGSFSEVPQPSSSAVAQNSSSVPGNGNAREWAAEIIRRVMELSAPL